MESNIYTCALCHKEVRFPTTSEIRCNKCTIRNGLRGMLNLMYKRKKSRAVTDPGPCQRPIVISASLMDDVSRYTKMNIGNRNLTNRSLKKFFYRHEINERRRVFAQLMANSSQRNKRQHESDNENSSNEHTESNRRNDKAKISKTCPTEEQHDIISLSI